jgi:metallo-beta-lactamase class B
MHKLWLLLTLTLALQTAFAQDAKLEITPLTDNFYIYSTYNYYQGYRIPAHGMYLVTEEGIALFDTPWDSTQFQPLLDSIELRHHQPVKLCIATHWHDDRTRGLEYYRAQGIATYTTAFTDQLSAENHMKRAEYLFRKDTTFSLGGYTFETFYPGEGHTKDNIVLWFPKQQILYGGCLIKGAKAKNLGYLGDANPQAYYGTLQQVDTKYPNPKFIIVSHHDWHDTRSLKHSIKLAKRLKKKTRH